MPNQYVECPLRLRRLVVGRLWHLVGRLRGHRVQMGLLKKPAAFASPQ